MANDPIQELSKQALLLRMEYEAEKDKTFELYICKHS